MGSTHCVQCLSKQPKFMFQMNEAAKGTGKYTEASYQVSNTGSVQNEVDLIDVVEN